MAQFPCLPFWPDAWVLDTAHLSPHQEGLYWRLCYTMWITAGCRVPNDNDWLAKRLRIPLQQVVDDLRPLIAEFCQTDGNWIKQKRVQKEFAKAFEFRGRMSVLAKQRKNKKSTPSSARSAAHADYPSPSLKQERKASFLGETEHPTPQQNEDDPARSFASAPDEGALAREPDSTPAEPKRVADKDPLTKTLAEINYEAFGIGTGRRKRTY